jgi:hypothetical protein
MKQIHLDALPDDEVYFLSSKSKGISKGVVEKVAVLNKGKVEYTITSENGIDWVGIVAFTPPELLAKITASFSEGEVC